MHKRNGLNAPRVLQPIEGDFTLTVKVTGDFEPGPESVTSEGGLRFTSAGLLLWHDDGNYVRLERNVMAYGVDVVACMPPLFELFAEGRYRGASPATTTEPYFNGKSTWLRIERQGDYFLAAISHDAATWLPQPKKELILPDVLHVGVAALNTANVPQQVTFSELNLVNNGG